MSIAVINIALPQPSSTSHHPLAHLPITLREDVKCNSGNMANGRIRQRITWLRLTRSVTLLLPRTLIIQIAGTTATRREIIRRTQGRMRQLREAFHHDLPGHGAGDGAALAAGQQRHGKEGAGGGSPQQWCQGQVGDANPVAVGLKVTTWPPATVTLCLP